MNKYFRKIAKALKQPESIVVFLGKNSPIIPDSLYLKCAYKHYIGKRLNLNSPKTFNEKLQWLKLYDKNDKYKIMVDKYDAKKYVSSIIGEEHIIPNLGVWNTFNEIDFNSLPDQFVLKCTHDSGGVIICRDKYSFNINSAKFKIKKNLRKNFFLSGREYPYKEIVPRIIAEKFMVDSNQTNGLIDYKLHFFNGECKAIMVCKNRFVSNKMEMDFYDSNWNHLDIKRGRTSNSSSINHKPEKLDYMISLGKMLAFDFPFVRVDFYIINNLVYFGEITFFPASGFTPFIPDKWDEIFGDWLKLDYFTKNKDS